jgi:predicted metal-dependent hydrolase
MGKLADAIEDWIRAEYAFRLGQDPYSNWTQEWLTKAEEKLRFCLTSKEGLREAARELGVKVDREERVSLRVPNLSKKQAEEVKRLGEAAGARVTITKREEQRVKIKPRGIFD